MNTTIHTNAPDVQAIARAAFPSYSGRTFSVEAFRASMSLLSYWEGGSRSYFALVNLATLQQMPIPQNGTPFDGRLSGGVTLSELPEGAALVKHCIFSGKDLGCTVYVNPANLAAMLPPPSDLTWEEKVVLAATSGLKSFARIEAAQRDTGISLADYQAARDSLKGKGLLNAAGAITNEGRNQVSRFASNHSLYDLNKPENGGKGVRGY